MARKIKTERERSRGHLLSRRIKESREASGQSQLQLSQAAGICVDTLRAIEGRRILHPGAFTLRDIAEALKTKLESLIPNKEETESQTQKTKLGRKAK